MNPSSCPEWTVPRKGCPVVDERKHTEYIESVDEPVEIVTEEDVYVEEAVSPVFVSVRRIVYFILDLIEILLAFRFVLKLLAADPAAVFVTLVYAVTRPLVAPFQGMFGQVAGQGSVIEWATLLAMAVYALLFWGLMRLLWIILGSTGTSTTGRHVYR